MADKHQMPSALQVANAISKVLSAKLADTSAEHIEIDRDEAALCLGLVNGVIKSLQDEAGG